jgi:protein involved in polysaccharide export with SLBB domain
MYYRKNLSDCLIPGRIISFGLAGALMVNLSGAALAQAPAAAPSAPVADVAGDYQLGSADRVRVIVFNEPSLSGEFVVNANGALSMPLIGDVMARGRTTGQIAGAIADLLRGGYVLEPKVSIDVLTFRPFYILGEVNKAGEYPYSSGLTVDAAVALAGGFTYRASRKKVTIRHMADEKAQKVDLTPDLRVLPGDTIRIGERYW